VHVGDRPDKALGKSRVSLKPIAQILQPSKYMDGRVGLQNIFPSIEDKGVIVDHGYLGPLLWLVDRLGMAAG